MKKMKAMMMATAMMAVSLSMTAQNQKSVNLTIGVLYPQTADLTISYEAGTKHHHAWEAFMNAAAKWKDCPSCGHICAESFWKQSTTWGIGMAYKPCVTRMRNAYGSLRLGGSLGSDLLLLMSTDNCFNRLKYILFSSSFSTFGAIVIRP